MKSLQELICKLSELVGILPFYFNYKNEKVETPLETKSEILTAMGFETDEESLKHWIEYFENYPWFNLTDNVYVVSENPQVSVYLKDEELRQLNFEISSYELINSRGQKINLSYNCSNFNIIERKLLQNTQYLKFYLTLPSLQSGYYKLKTFSEKRTSESLLIIAPDEAFIPIRNKTWGLHVNLWSIRGRGIEGDFSHLKEIADYVTKNGGFISINPLHFNNPSDIYGLSPYSAISREFKTPLYITEVTIEEKNREIFEYERIWNEKIGKFKEKFYQNLNKEREDIKSFKEYKKNLCPSIKKDLKYFAVFCFLREKFGANWQDWEEKYKKPTPQVIDKVYNENYKAVLFHEYLQWLIEHELETLTKYNICLDLGFGSVKSSFDVWVNQDIYASNADYGAPPDDFNPKGQKWGFPPLIPFKLREKGYIPFIKILRSNMKHKLLRIDHALGLFRTFWIPHGKEPSYGAYVKNNWRELLGIICLESHLNKTGIIGEDLGTAEEWMKEELIKRKISSWRVFYFEKNAFGFKSSEIYPEEALCSITTHDLPPLKGYWNGRDIELRKKFEIFDQTTSSKAYKERLKDKEEIINLLEKNGLLDSREDFEKIFLSIIKFLSQTKSKYLLIYPEDILMMEEQTNFPGTTTEYPNWQRKLPVTVEDFLKLPIIEKLLTILKETERINYFN